MESQSQMVTDGKGGLWYSFNHGLSIWDDILIYHGVPM